MKLQSYLLIVGIAVAAVLTSCKEDETGDKFSPLTPEQSKAKIEDSGVQMLDEVKLMEQEPAMQANIAFLTYLSDGNINSSNTSLKVNLQKTIAFAPIFASANYSQTGMKGMLKSIQVNPADDPETFQQLYNQLVGIYAWNSEMGDWDYTQTGDVILFQFPSTQDGTVNNASYTVSYTGYTGPNPIDNYDGDLPQNVTTELKVDNATILTYTVDVAYDGNGYPTSIETTLTMGTWVWYAMASNTGNTKFKTEFSFKHGDTILLKLTLDASGNWNQDNIDANTRYYVSVWNENNWEWQEIEVTKNDEYEYSDVKIQKVVTNGNASFQAMNVKITGSINVEKLADAMDQIDTSYDWETQQEQINNAQVKAINDNVTLSVRYADSDEIIAMVEAYPVSEDYSYDIYYYDGEWHDTPKTITETDYWFDMRFVYADGSKVDAATYFGEGFDSLTQEITDYLDELNQKYGNN